VYPQGGAPLLITQKVALRQVTPEERRDLKQLARSRTPATRRVEHARIRSAAAAGPSATAIVPQLGVSRPTS
jgi:hypothetical protein